MCERKKRSDVPILQICIPGVYCIAFVCTKGNFFAVLLCFASRRGGGGSVIMVVTHMVPVT